MVRTQAFTIARGENPWQLDLHLGRIEGKGAPVGESTQLRYVWRDSAGLTFSSAIQVDADGKFELPFVPAGPGQVSRSIRGEDKAWRSVGTKDVEVTAGETTVVEAP